MDAQALTKALAGRWLGDYGMARCPAHDDRKPSLRIDDSDNGRPLLFCYAGCEQAGVIDALRARGLWEGRELGRARISERPKSDKHSDNDEHHRISAALTIWRASQPVADTFAAAYLRHRGLTLTIPPTLRYHAGLKHGPTGALLPAMVGAIQAPDRRVTGVQRTFLRADGRGKANVSSPKMTLGLIGKGAVRLAAAGPVLGVAEGIETGLSAQQLFDVPVWCRCGSSLARMWLPPGVIEVQVFADNGGPGEAAAEQARRVFEEGGKRVFIRRPPEQIDDWNDSLKAQARSEACWP